MIRRVGHAPRADQSYTLRPGAYAILPLGHRVLLTAQSSRELDIQLPGGGIDPGESPVQALHREVLEETGWAIAYPRRLGAFRRFVYMPEYDLWAEKLVDRHRRLILLAVSAGRAGVAVVVAGVDGGVAAPVVADVSLIGDRRIPKLGLGRSGRHGSQQGQQSQGDHDTQ
jgi:8-oxo-dGTP pyrophosphatase MutT (NUDIX family)